MKEKNDVNRKIKTNFVKKVIETEETTRIIDSFQCRVSNNIAELTQLSEKDSIGYADLKKVEENILAIEQSLKECIDSINKKSKEVKDRQRAVERQTVFHEIVEELKNDWAVKSPPVLRPTAPEHCKSYEYNNVFEIKKIFNGKENVEFDSLYDLIRIPFCNGNIVLLREKEAQKAKLIYEDTNFYDSLFIPLKVENHEQNEEQKKYFALSEEEKKLLEQYNPGLNEKMHIKRFDTIFLHELNFKDFIQVNLGYFLSSNRYEELCHKFYLKYHRIHEYFVQLLPCVFEYISSIAENYGVTEIDVRFNDYNSYYSFEKGVELHKKYATTHKAIKFNYCKQ